MNRLFTFIALFLFFSIPVLRGECASRNARDLSEAEQQKLADYWRQFSEETPRLEDVPPVPQDKIDSCVSKALTFLIENQNACGSWGGPYKTKKLNIYSPVPGGPQAYAVGTAALCVCALCDWEQSAPAALRQKISESINKSQNWLTENLADLRRPDPQCTYNNWGYAYGIQALVRLYQRSVRYPQKDAKEFQKECIDLIQRQIELLHKYECIDGGWAYYNFDNPMAKPSGSTISFVTAAVLVALEEAARLKVDRAILPSGKIEIPQALIDRGVASLVRQQNPDFSYFYGEYLKSQPNRGVNRSSGSLGRTQSCNLALYYWATLRTEQELQAQKDGKRIPPTALPPSRFVTQQILTDCLDRFCARIGWLDGARKRSVPHDHFNQIAGYFYYYGHFYAGYVLQEIDNPKDQDRISRHLTNILLEVQDQDGSYWDFVLYDYQQYYGTAMALSTLRRCEKLKSK